jgi:2-dehydro-3-deoxygluconokinase
MTTPIEVVTVGETLALLTNTNIGPLRSGSTFALSTAGAESNVAIGLSRLGHRTRWIGRVGDDEFGRLVLAQLRSEDVDVSYARVDCDAQTSLMLKKRRTSELTSVTYYRRGLAGSLLSPADIEPQALQGALVLHVTGITPALSAAAHDAVIAAMATAAEAGLQISFDVNYRSALWSAHEARATLSMLAQRADFIFASADELALLGDVSLSDPATQAKQLAEGRPGRQVVVKQGSAGAFVVTAGNLHHCPAVKVRMVDPVGAGDAFVAGYLSATLDGVPPSEALARGCAAGAFAVATDGDWEGLPRRDELSLLPIHEESTLR